ncbi:MAG: membrane protein insertion efficiency factor YidD [Pseudonocardiales bacterium]
MSPAARVLSWPIVGYRRWISPAFPATCRFIPSCSGYALEAVRTRGAVVGLTLAMWRLLRCHPFNPGGFDPVPPRRKWAHPLSRAHRRNRPPASSVECSTPHSGAAR